MSDRQANDDDVERAIRVYQGLVDYLADCAGQAIMTIAKYFLIPMLVMGAVLALFD